MLKKIPYTTRRSGVFYVQFWCDNQLIRTSLRTDSARKAESIMLQLRPLVVDCINGKGSVENLKKTARKCISMKDEKELIKDYASSKIIEIFNSKLNENIHTIITDSPRSAHEIIQESAKIAAALDDPLTAYEAQNNFINLYFERPENKLAIAQGLKTKDQITKEATRQWQTCRDILRIQFNTLSFQDKNTESLLTKHITQANSAFTELTTSTWGSTAEGMEEKEQPKIILLSDLHKEHVEHKTDIFITRSKIKPLSHGNKKILQRQNKYYMKFIAVAGDINILSTSKDYIFNSLIQLFNWPNENQSGSKYHAKTKENIAKSKTQEWHNSIATELDEIADDDNIEKSRGTVQEVLGWLQELYKYAIEKEYITTSPVSIATEKYKIYEKQAKKKRSAYYADEVIKILNHVTITNHKAKWPITLMCYTGCRNSELYRITNNDIDLETKSIYINGTKTAAAKRHIPLAKKLEENGFLEFIKDKDGSTPILDGTVLEQQLNQIILEITEKLGIQETISKDGDAIEFRSFYSLRKSVRTYATYTGVSSDIIEICLGHKISGSAMQSVYQDAKVLAKEVEPMRPIFDKLPW